MVLSKEKLSRLKSNDIAILVTTNRSNSVTNIRPDHGVRSKTGSRAGKTSIHNLDQKLNAIA